MPRNDAQSRLLEYKPTYVTPTSYQILAMTRNRPLEDNVMLHPYLDRLLTEEELHIASNINLGDPFTDVLTYITHVGIGPQDMDWHAALAYNPKIYDWFLEK